MPKLLLSFQGASTALSWPSQAKRDQSGCQLSGSMTTTKPKASQSRLRRRGGSLSQPDPKAKPVKKISCQANGLKNQPRSDHHSAGKSQPNAVCAR